MTVPAGLKRKCSERRKYPYYISNFDPGGQPIRENVAAIEGERRKVHARE